VRQLEGRIGADSTASYVEFGRRASIHTHTHRVELAGRQPPVDRSLCHHNYRTRIPQPADACLACRLTHRSCCRRYGYTVECRGPRLHARPSTAGAAGYNTAAAAANAAAAVVGLFFLILSLLAQSTDLHRTKPILVCRGHAMYTPTLIAGREAIFECLRQNLPNIL